MATLTIPQSVQDAILRNRAHFRELDARARTHNAARQAEPPGGVSFQVGFVTKPETLDVGLQFWTIGDDQALEDFLFEDLLAGLDPETDWDALPRGYRPLIDVLEFERHCQFEGWTAVSNKGAEEMRRIIESYALVGLPDEARALAAVTDAYLQLPSDEDPAFYDVLRKAYVAARGAGADFDDRIEDRLPHVFRFVRNHPEWFGVPG